MRISDWSSDVCSSDLFFLFETENIKLQLHAGDFGFLQLDDAPHAMLRINDIVTDFENGSACGHSSSFQWPCPGTGKRVNSFISGPLSRGIGLSGRSEEHTSELQSLMRISYAVFCLKKKNKDS